MGNPAFQMIGTASDTSGAFGVCSFDSAPFGGNEFERKQLPTYHLGSDDLQADYRKRSSAIVHFRQGLPVSVRPFSSLRRWHVRFSVVLEANLPMLQDFYEARTFNLLPEHDGEEKIPVYWVGDEFAPVYIKPGVYRLEFDIEELLS